MTALVSILQLPIQITDITLEMKVKVAYIENSRFASFDIKFTRQGFENAC